MKVTLAQPAMAKCYEAIFFYNMVLTTLHTTLMFASPMIGHDYELVRVAPRARPSPCSVACASTAPSVSRSPVNFSLHVPHSCSPNLRALAPASSARAISHAHTQHTRTRHESSGRITRKTDPNATWAQLAVKSIDRYRDAEAESGVKFFHETGKSRGVLAGLCGGVVTW